MSKKYSDDILKMSYEIFIDLIISDMTIDVYDKNEAYDKFDYSDFCDAIVKTTNLGNYIIDAARIKLRIVKLKNISLLNN